MFAFWFILCLLMIGIGIFLIKRGTSVLGKILVTVSLFLIIMWLLFIILVLILLASVYSVFYCTMAVILAILIFTSAMCRIWGLSKRRHVLRCLISAIAVCVIVIVGFFMRNIYISNIPTVRENDDLLESYEPYGEISKIAVLEEESDLYIDTDIPKMDGATALYPVYSAFARAVYPKESILYTNYTTGSYNDRVLKCTKTANAYERIVTGDADIIFVAGPSKEQEKFAEENGVELVYTPIGREGFVFFVNSKNPIDNITVEQIKSIYSGEIVKWRELGVAGFGKIKAFQRNEGSGSQTALIKIMGDRPLAEAPKDKMATAMDGIIEWTADYKNHKNAIGYSFRFYATEMVNNDQIKLLSINGVYPSEENIENGTYPFSSEFYAVTRSDADENTLKLLEWIQGSQGQKLIEMTGYTPFVNE